MSVVQRSNYSISFNNKSSATFNLFHQGEGGGKPHTTAWPSKELAPGGETCFAWDITAGQVSQDTTTGHVYYCLTGSFGSDPPPRVWGVQLTGYTPTGGLPKTVFQYAAGVLKAVLPAGEDIGPDFWIDAGKDWRDSYSFIIPAGSKPGNLKITVADHPFDGPVRYTPSWP
jgi:hypothetical protein